MSSWCREPASPPTTTSWSCCSGSMPSSGPAPRRSRPSCPYFSYAKGDKKDEPRVSRSGPASCADAIEAAGVDRVITLDLHAPQVQGFFKVPVDDLYALPVLCDAIAAEGLPDIVVVAPDAGFAKKARQWSERLHGAAGHRRQAAGRPLRNRRDHRAHRIGGRAYGPDRRRLHHFGRHSGRRSPRLVERGAASVYAAVSHGLLDRTGRGAARRQSRSSGCS